jgi:outer membrane protein assembly factor BamB
VPVWRYDISRDAMQKSFHGRMLIGDSLVFIGTDIPSGHIYAFDKRNGSVRWKHFAGLGVHGDIKGSDSVLYALTKEDTLLCCACSTGDVIWSFHPGEEAREGNGSSPCLAEDQIFFRDSRNHVYALDASNGELIWKRALLHNVSTSPCFWRGGVYAGTEGGSIHRLNAATGEIEASLVLAEPPYGTITVTGGGLILFTGQRGRGSALISVDPDITAVCWRQPAPAGTWLSTYRPDIWNGNVLAGTNEGIVMAFRVADGSAEWKLDVGGTVKTVSHYGDTLLVGTFEGMLHALEIAFPADEMGIE